MSCAGCIFCEDGEDYCADPPKPNLPQRVWTWLRMAFEGPPGPAGPQGPTGGTGASGILEVVGLHEGARIQIWDKTRNLRWSGTLQRMEGK